MLAVCGQGAGRPAIDDVWSVSGGMLLLEGMSDEALGASQTAVRSGSFDSGGGERGRGERALAAAKAKAAGAAGAGGEGSKRKRRREV